jgi:hypothetical protein
VFPFSLAGKCGGTLISANSDWCRSAEISVPFFPCRKNEAALLACSIYVDLNPIRAGISATPEASEFTGAFERIAARQAERGFLPLLLDDYLQLLDWTGRQLRRDKSGAIPARLAPILERLHVSAEHWSDTVPQFGRWFHRAVGSAASLRRFAERRGRRWLHGLSRSRLAFGQ